MTELEALRRLCDAQRRLGELRVEQHRAAVQHLADYLQEGRRFADASVQELVALYDDAGDRFFRIGEVSVAGMMLGIQSEFMARGLEPAEFLKDLDPDEFGVRPTPKS
jgi:hypothetical protein